MRIEAGRERRDGIVVIVGVEGDNIFEIRQGDLQGIKV